MKSVADTARQLILDAAEDEPPLWELTCRLALAGGSSRQRLYASLTPQEVKAALEALLREGHVLLYDAANPTSPISLRDALARIADDRNWAPSAVQGHRPAHIVILTESGGAEYRSLSAA
jgi:hypothetical protein